MTEQDIKKLIKLIKSNGLYCNVQLEMNETGLLEGKLSYSEVRVRIYKDKKYKQEILTLQLLLNTDDETYFLDNESYQYGEKVIRQAYSVVEYCKYLIKKYM